MPAPNKPYNPSEGFNFHDCWTAVDTDANDKGWIAKANCACTLYSQQVFNGSQQVQTTMTLLDLQGSIVGFGIVGENSTESCRTNCVGHSDILDSIGCAVGRGEVIIVYRGRTLFRAPVNTSGRVDVAFELINGRATFIVAGQRLNCPDLQKLNLTKGRFRIAVSPTKEKQAGIFAEGLAAAQQQTAGASADANAPTQPYNPAQGFTFHDRWRSIDVSSNNPRLLVCRKSIKGTCYTEQVFRGNQSFRATCRFADRQDKVVAFGILGHRSTKQCADYVLGETEIPDSIGCVLKGNSVALIYKDDLVFQADVPMKPIEEISVILKEGKLRFELDGRNLNCDKIKELNFADGTFRLGCSLTQEDQKSEMYHIGTDGSQDPDAPATMYDPAGGFNLHDRWRSIDIKDWRQAICRNSVKGTVYTKEVFKGSTDFTAKCHVKSKGNGPLAFGILGHQSTKQCADYVLGEKEIPDSIGCVISGDTVAIMFKDEIVFQADVTMAAQPVISVIFKDGHVRFELDGRNIDCDKIKGLGFGEGHFRIGVSMTKEGQEAALLGGTEGPDSQAPHFAFDGGKLSFHDRWRSMDVCDKTKLVCRQSRKATTYTEQVIKGNMNTRQTFSFVKRGNGVVAFGVLGHQHTRACAEYVLGEKEIKDSIGCVLKGNTVAIMYADKVIFQADVELKPKPTITINFKNGNITFEVDGRGLNCPELAKLGFGNGQFRLGVSMTEEGQEGSMGLSAAGGEVKVMEGEKDAFYKWKFTDAEANRSGAAVSSKQRGSKAFSEQVFSNSKQPGGLVCDACYRGDKDRKKFDSIRWKCMECADFDFCTDCYFSSVVKHQHDRKKFDSTLGGTFHEMRLAVTDHSANTIDFGIVPVGEEEKFGDDATKFVTGGPTGWARGKSIVNTTPVRPGDEVWIRVLADKLVVLCNKKQLCDITIPVGTYRFAVRFGRDGQTVTLRPRQTMPPRGTPVEVTSDAEFLAQEARLVGLEPSSLVPGTRGWLIDEDTDGTVRLCTESTTPPAVWVPRSVMERIAGRDAPAPTVGDLRPGHKVVRNQYCWVWGQQDGGSRGNTMGTVLDLTDGWVKVRWSSGAENSYAYSRGLYNVLAWVGNIGDRVMRNPAAYAAGSVGGYGAGTVESASVDGLLTVKWDSGETGQYRFNEEAQEVQLAGPAAVAPLGGAGAGAGPSSVPSVPAPLPTPSGTNAAPAREGVPNPAALPPAPVVPAPAPPKPPVPDAVERVRGAETANLTDVGLKPAMRLKKSYTPPAPLADCMVKAAAAFPKIDEMEFIVEQCVAIAQNRRDEHGKELEVDEAMSIALYTFDLGPMSDCPHGSDNFYFVLNEVFRSRDQQAIIALQPFMYWFKMAWNKLPNITGTFYRGIPKSALSLVSEKYVAGREVYWSSITSLSVDRPIAEKFAAKEGPGGILMEITIVDSRSISKYSAIPRESEVILEPNTKLVVVQELTAMPNGTHLLKLLQVKQEKAFVF